MKSVDVGGTKGKLKNLSEVELRIAAMAYLMGDLNLTQGEAWAKLEPIFHRVRPVAVEDERKARRNGWLITRFAEERFAPELLKQIKMTAHLFSYNGGEYSYEVLQRELQRHSKDVLANLRVYLSDEDVGWDVRLEDFGYRAAGYLWELLTTRGAAAVGVTWGHTLASVVGGIEGHVNQVKKHRRTHGSVEVIPTTGEPLGTSGYPERSSTSLSERLSAVLNSERKPVLSLRGVPPVIPQEFKSKKGERKILLDFIQHLRSYKEIFVEGSNGKRPWVERVDTIVTSVGSFHSWLEFNNELVTIGGVSREDLQQSCLGDVGGVLIPNPRPEFNADEFNEIASLWTGIQRKDFQRIAGQAKDLGRPGVIVVAAGENKKAIVFELVKQKLVNELIVDQSLAAALADECHIRTKLGG